MMKDAVVAALREELERRVDDLQRSQKQATASMRVDGDHRPANRGERGAVTAAGYLTAGLEERLTELRAALDLLDRAGSGPRDRAVTGALLTVEAHSDGEERTYFVFPGASGTTLGEVTVVSPESPVGSALWGLAEDDDAELPTGAVTLISVC
ncbi:MAG: GreA/GreB family elongation factor [Myxococcota bacterium]